MQVRDGEPPTLEQLAVAALARPSEVPAVEFEGQWIGWGRLRGLADQLASILADNRIQQGAKIALIARNHPACIGAFIALIAARLNIRMVYPFQSPAGLAAEIEALQPDAVVALSEDFAEPVRSSMRRSGSAAIALRDYHAEGIAELQRHAPSSESEATPYVEILTSGTTGKPKPFQISYDMIARDIVMAGTVAGTQRRDAEELEPVLLYFPIGNISGLYTTLPAMLGGRRTVLLERFSVEGWRDFVVRYRPAVSGMPPAAIQMVLDANIPKEDLASIRVFGAGAAPLDPAVQRAFEERYGIPILLSYGATEFGGPVTRMTPEMYERDGRTKIGTVGKAMPGVKLRIVDPRSGDVLPPGMEGLLEVVSPRVGPEWIRTSDIAVIDEDGYLFHRGRADGAIMRGGFKVLPETIEKALLTHPAVSAAAVVGVPDDRLGQVPAAAIILKPGRQATAEALEAHLRERVLKTHIPVHWRFVDDFPRTELSFKVKQSALRQMFA